MKTLVVEDETAFRQVLEGQFVKSGIECMSVGTGNEALELLKKKDFDVVVTDLRLPDIDGLEIMKRARKNNIDIPFLLMTAYASLNTAVSALKIGAVDYLIKPVRVTDIVRRTQQIYDMELLKQENTLLKKIVQEGEHQFWFSDTPASQSVQRLLSRVSNTDLTVLLMGESGTGKGMYARLLHSMSNRADKPFLSINCGAIPENLVESELFGHVKGAFTGADRTHDGLFVSASGGSLFLDEIGELPISVQVKLLTVLEERVVRPVGASQVRKVDTRIIAATNRDLEQMVHEGRFRQDLFYRLNIFPIPLPSLREQKEAISSAAKFFINKYSEMYNTGNVRISQDVTDAFNAYSWPGNLRELDNVIKRALLLREGDEIEMKDLPPSLAGTAGYEESETKPLLLGDYKARVQAFEMRLIKQAMATTGGDKRAAAKELDISLSTLYRKLEESCEI